MNVLKHFSFKVQVLVAVGFACFLCGLISISIALFYKSKEFRMSLISRTHTIDSDMSATSAAFAKVTNFSEIADRITHQYPSAHDIPEEEKHAILNRLPFMAALNIAKNNAIKEHYSFSLFSEKPRNPNYAPTADQTKILARFSNNPDLKEIIVDTPKILTVYHPIRVTSTDGCLNCHGNPANSPWKNGTDILGNAMENMREGAIKGVYAISYDENQMALIQEENKTSASTVSLIIFILLGSALTLLVSAFYIQGIINRFRKLTQAIRAVGMKIDEVSIKIASSSQTLATGTAKQSSSIEQTDHAIKEIKTRISQTADNAKNSAHMSEVSQTKALAGQTTVDTMAQSILDINASNDAIMKQIDHSNQQLSEIVTVIQEIGNKTKVINDIVFQTKLLSFNASVEAARAGEHGKGFAVVAQEIGNLAQLSGTAAKQISDILSGSITKVESIVRDTKVKVEHLLSEGKQKVDYGTTIAKQCKETLEQIVHDVKEVSAMVNEISEASQEQAKGIGDVATSITELSHTTHQNSKTTEQTAEAAGSLAEQAQSLTSALDELERTIEGSFTSANLDQDFQNTLIGSQDRQPPRLKTLEKPSKKPNASVKSKPQVHSDHPDHNTAYDKFQAFPDKQDKNEAHSISHVTHVPAQQDHATPDRDNPDFEE